MFEQGEMVRNKNTLRTGEVLKTYPCGTCRVRYPVYGDEDRDFEFFHEPETDLHSIKWLECMDTMYKGRNVSEPHTWYLS
jgi:hypothetical protein